MADIFDKSQDLIDLRLKQQINEAKAKNVENTKKHYNCISCGDELSEFRANNFYATCVDCQQSLENK